MSATLASPAADRAGIHLPYPHPGQQTVLQHPARFRFLCAGRRWFKTTLDMIVAVQDALAGLEVLWGAPTYDQCRIGYNYTKFVMAGHAEFSATRMEGTFPTGGLIRWRSLDDPENARGHTAQTVIIDEAGKVPQDAWYEVIRPMLMTTRGGALINGTPNGRNWFWREFLRAANGDDSEAMAWQAPTVGAQLHDGVLSRVPHPLENPQIPWDEIVHLHETLPERVFRQEILAEFLDDAGGVFRNVAACIGGTLEDAPSHPTRRYLIGLDLAKHEDFTVALVVDQQRRHVVQMDRFNKADWPLQKARIAALAQHWNNALIYADATGVGDPIYDDLRAAGLRIEPIKFTAQMKEQLVNNAVLLVEQRQVSYPDIPVLIAELSALEYQAMPSGRYRMAAPEGLHDDAAMAFCLACWGLERAAGWSLASVVYDAAWSPIAADAADSSDGGERRRVEGAETTLGAAVGGGKAYFGDVLSRRI